MMTSSSPSSSLPRILCFHGGGSNAKIMEIQIRLIHYQLRDHFEFIFANGPFVSGPGPGILPFFDDMDPYYRWSGPNEATAIDNLLERIAKVPGNERIVGCLGFSQGTRVVGGLLRRHQLRADPSQVQGLHFRFGILCMGGDAPIALKSSPPIEDSEGKGSQLISIPTLHVHGVHDFCYSEGKTLASEHYDPGSSIILDVDAGHHFPRDKNDVIRVCDFIMEMYDRPENTTSANSDMSR